MHSSFETHTAGRASKEARSFSRRAVVWTPDHHVTRPMSPPAPSDPTTFWSASPASCQSPFPPLDPAGPTLPVPLPPATPTATLLLWPSAAKPPPPLHAPTPQLAHTGCPRSIPRPPPREHRLQDDLYHSFTRDAYLSSATAAARELAGTLNVNPTYYYPGAPAIAAAATTTTTIPATATTSIPTTITATSHSAVKHSRQRPQHRLKRPRRTHSRTPPPPAKRNKPTTTTTATAATTPKDDLHFVDSSLFATLNAAMMEIASRQLPAQHQPITASSSKLPFKDTTWTFPKKLKKKRRRPSEIFNINFGFGFSSRRRQSSDYSPHVSPRTSISSPSGSPRAELMESFKRQRIDSTGSDIHAAFSNNNNNTTKTAADNISLSPSTIVSQIEDPHPGQLVDFSLSPASLAPPTPAPAPAPAMMLPLPELSSEPTPRSSSDAYHEYLATTQRRNSFPAVDWAARHANMITKLDHAATKEDDEIDPKDTTTIPLAPLQPLPTQPLEAPKCELRRTTSDPSTERFLTHIRASLEARRSKSGRTWQTYPVFADEVEKGFLDDAPL